jgi:cytochrome c
MSRSRSFAWIVGTSLALVFAGGAADVQAQAVPSAATHDAAKRFHIGRAATAQEIAGWDIDIRPDGQGAPAGHGSVKDGEEISMAKCAACHGEFGESAGRWPQIAGGAGSLGTNDPVKTVGSYFGSASTVLDYVRRAMPFGDAQSLTNDELYAVVAYVLNLNDLVDDKFVLSKETLASVKMPNAGGFFEDDRESAEKAFWTATPCMKDCKTQVEITGRARVIDVTPDDKAVSKVE